MVKNIVITNNLCTKYNSQITLNHSPDGDSIYVYTLSGEEETTGLFTPPTRQFCFVSTQFRWVLSCPRRRCKQISL